MRQLINAGKSVKEIYEALVIDDIGMAADDSPNPFTIRPTGVDGYISLEVNPRLPTDTERPHRRGRQLFKTLNRKNRDDQNPGGAGGLPAIEEAIYRGINVNVTNDLLD